jgi:hypothetical protein
MSILSRKISLIKYSGRAREGWPSRMARSEAEPFGSLAIFQNLTLSVADRKAAADFPEGPHATLTRDADRSLPAARRTRAGFRERNRAAFRPCGFNSSRQRVDGAACAVNHNFPICRGVPPLRVCERCSPDPRVPELPTISQRSEPAWRSCVASAPVRRRTSTLASPTTRGLTRSAAGRKRRTGRRACRRSCAGRCKGSGQHRSGLGDSRSAST